jgi:RNA polymerase sigma-70 factor (ECF subfamily)
VHRVSQSLRSHDRDGGALDPDPLELDVDGRPRPNQSEDIDQARDSCAIPQIQLRERGPCGSRDVLAMRRRIMVHDHDAIRGNVDVELDRVRAISERGLEARQCVLKRLAGRAAVCDSLDSWDGRGLHHTRVLFRDYRCGKHLTTHVGRRLPHGRMTGSSRGGSNKDHLLDADLVERWKAGDQRAAAELVDRHASALARFASSCGARDEIEELVQDTFVRAFSSLEGFRWESSFRTWLFTIERRLLMDRRRAEHRRPQGSEIGEGDAVSAFDALDELVADEAQLRVRKAIGKLTPTQREVFVLRVTEGLSYREIADTVSTTEGAARVHYHNAVRAIKDMLDE